MQQKFSVCRRTMSNIQAKALRIIADTQEQEGRCDDFGIEPAAIREAADTLDELEAKVYKFESMDMQDFANYLTSRYIKSIRGPL